MRLEVSYMERSVAEVIKRVVDKELTRKQASGIPRCSIRIVDWKINRFLTTILLALDKDTK